MRKIPKDMTAGSVHKTKNCGNIEIVEYKNSMTVIARFKDTGACVISRSAHIRNGQVKDAMSPSLYGVGYIGEGRHKASSKGVKSKAFTTWEGMFIRCHSESVHKKYPTYIGCAVCAEWHNFQSYADWHEINYIDGYELDKDIKVDGNKLYSSCTCMFVTRAENVIKASATSCKFTNPQGEVVDIYNLTEFCRENGLQQGNMANVNKGNRRSHKGWTSA